MQPQGYSLSSCMPLIVLAPYFLFGMLQAQAVSVSLIVVAAYGIGGYLAGITGPQRYFDVAVVVVRSRRRRCRPLFVPARRAAATTWPRRC